MVDLFGGKSNHTLSSLRHIIFTNKVATAKAFVTPEQLPQLHLQQDSIAYVCTFKLWYGWRWQMVWTQLNGDGNRKIISSFQLWPKRLLRLTNSWKLFIATVQGMQILSMQLQTLRTPCIAALSYWKLWQSKQHSRGRYWGGGWHSKLNGLKLRPILWTKVFVQ